METTKERAIDRIIQHMRKVQDNMILLENNSEYLPFKITEFKLLRRAIKHDTDKFKDSFIVGFSKLPDAKERTEEEEMEAKKYMQVHYQNERHHQPPKSYLDLCKMVCDWDAIARRNNNKENCLWFYKNVVLKERPYMKKYNNIIIYIANILRLLRLKSRKS